MLDDVYFWFAGSAFYLLCLVLGIGLCLLRRPRAPRVQGGTIAALLVALVAWCARPWLTQWPQLLRDRFPNDVAFQSFVGTGLEAVPIGLLLWTLMPSLRSPGVAATDFGDRGFGRRNWPRWVWMAGAGVVCVSVVLVTIGVVFADDWRKYRDGLLGAVPFLLFLIWARFRLLRAAADLANAYWTRRALEAAAVLWPIQAILVGRLLPVDGEHPVSLLIASLCSGLPIGLLLLAAYRLPVSQQNAGPSGNAQPPLSRGERLMVELLWLGFWGLGGGALGIGVLVLGILGFQAVFQPDWYDGSGAGRGGGPGTGAALVLVGAPIFCLLGFLLGVTFGAWRSRRRSSDESRRGEAGR